MNKLVLLGGAALLAMSGIAVAQSATPDAAAAPAPADTAVAAPNDATTAAAAPAAAPAADVAAPTADAAAAPAPAAPADQTASAAPAAPAAVNADAAAKVNAEWAKYDEGNKGKLTPLEFGSWILAAQGQDVTASVEKTQHSKKSNLPAVKVLNATSGQFAKADTDKDKAISPNELAAFLSA